MVRRLALITSRQQRLPVIHSIYLPSITTSNIRNASSTLGLRIRRALPQNSGLPDFAALAIPRTIKHEKAYTPSSFTPLAQERKTVLIIGSSIAGTVLALQPLTHPVLRSRYGPVVFDSSANLPNFQIPRDTIFSHSEGQTGAVKTLTKQAMWPNRQSELGSGLDGISQNTERISMYRQLFFGP